MEKGFKNLFALKGGFHGWKDAGYPTETGSLAVKPKLKMMMTSKANTSMAESNSRLRNSAARSFHTIAHKARK